MSMQCNDDGRRIHLTQYAGPAGAETSRRRYQLTDTATGNYIDNLMPADIAALLLDLGLEAYRGNVRNRRDNGEQWAMPESWDDLV